MNNTLEGLATWLKLVLNISTGLLNLVSREHYFQEKGTNTMTTRVAIQPAVDTKTRLSIVLYYFAVAGPSDITMLIHNVSMMSGYLTVYGVYDKYNRRS